MSKTGTGPQGRIGHPPDEEKALTGPVGASVSLRHSVRHAVHGLGHAVRTQRNMRIHVSFAVVVFALGLLLRLTTMEMALLVVAVALVFVAEVSNTALEEAVNLASPVHHPLARMSKDAAAGAVLLAAAAAIVVGVLVIGPHLWALL